MELLVVILIIMLVSAVTLPTVVSSWRERQAINAASLLHASIEQAKAEATAANAPRGIRLLPDDTIGLTRLPSGQIDPSAPLACNRWVALETPGTYSEGTVSIYAGFAYNATITGGVPALVLEHHPGHWERVLVLGVWQWQWILDAPASWAWNIRVGDRVTLGVGAEYCVCGPMVVPPGGGNSEQFVNYGSPGTISPIVRTYLSPDGSASIQGNPEYLLLVNGKDDNADGWIDNGWDGVDNDGDTLIDEPDEWEIETWQAGQSPGVQSAAYSIRRRPSLASGSSRTVVLPGSMVVDLSTWGYAFPNRSRLPVDLWAGSVDIMFGADGRVMHDSPYASMARVGMTAGWLHFWLGDKSDVPLPPLPIELTPDQTAWLLPPAKEDMRLVTVNKTGRVVVSDVDLERPADAMLRTRQGSR